ncbi:MAG: cyclic nucleotide-binding domain-containing protein [Myxococcota bacterium]
MLDQIRPCLLTSAVVRQRSDGSLGIYDPVTGNTFETTQEQAGLIPLFDGKRTLLEISAEYLSRHGFVPFAAVDELVWGLVEAGLLMHPPNNLERLNQLERSTWVELLAPITHARLKLWWPAALRAVELLAWPALAVWVALQFPRAALRPLDVALFYPGMVLALVLRDRLVAAVAALAGFPSQRTQLSSLLRLVWWLAPDTGSVVLMDRRPQVLANLGALLGVSTAVVLAWPSPGMSAGAGLVALLTLCPLLPSAGEELISLLSGLTRVDAQLRGFVGLPLARSLVSFDFGRWGAALFLGGVFSVLWLGALFWGILGVGLPTAFGLIELLSGAQPWEQALAAGGAMALLVLCPAALVLASFQLIESAFDFLWPRETGGRQTGGAAELAMFRSIPLFSMLGDEDLKRIAAHSKQVTYGAGERIVEEGAPGNTFYSIRRGVVSVVQGENTPSPRVVARLGTGDCFGETAMLKDGARQATVRAVTEVMVIELASDAFEKVMATIGGVDFASVLRAAATIGKSKLFRGLPPERLSSLASRFVPRSVPAGTDVVKYGETGHEFFLIARGNVDVLSADGKLLTKLGEGEPFGEIALLRNVPRTATVRTTSDTLLLVLGREVFLQALQADLSLSARVEEIAASRTVSGTELPAAAG